MDAGWLVSAQEASIYRGDEGFDAQRPPRTRNVAAAPAIEVLPPEPVNDLKACGGQQLLQKAIDHRLPPHILWAALKA